jgi:CRP-like cAMP-binding protein
VYFAEDGVLSLLAITPAGETIEVASAGRSGAIWPILESGSPHGYLTAVAPGPVQASRIDVALLQAILSENGPLNHAFEAVREALVLQLRQNAMCSGLHAVEHRLARWVLEAADRLESGLVPVTQETVAQRLGVRRTTVTLVASRLQDIEAMRWGRSCIEILNRQRLEASACACYASLRERANGLTSSAPRASDRGDAS